LIAVIAVENFDVDPCRRHLAAQLSKLARFVLTKLLYDDIANRVNFHAFAIHSSEGSSSVDK